MMVPSRYMKWLIIGVILVPLFLTWLQVTMFGRETISSVSWARMIITVLVEWPLAAAIYVRIGRAEKKLRQEIELREKFLAMVSHDLKSPICAIRLETDFMLKTQKWDPRALKNIFKRTKEMEELINDLILSESARAGRLQLCLTVVPVKDVVQEVSEFYKRQADKKHIQIKSEIEPTLSCRCDLHRLRQIFRNVVGNALKYAPENASVTIRARRDKEVTMFSVENTGDGISQKELEGIFDAYRRGASKASGHGLGLFIVKFLVESHRGKVWAESSPGKGFGIHFTLCNAL